MPLQESDKGFFQKKKKFKKEQNFNQNFLSKSKNF